MSREQGARCRGEGAARNEQGRARERGEEQPADERRSSQQTKKEEIQLMVLGEGGEGKEEQGRGSRQGAGSREQGADDQVAGSREQ